MAAGQTVLSKLRLIWPGLHSPGGREELVDWRTVVYLLLAILLVLLNGFFVVAEFALVKVRSSRIEELMRKGHRRAKVTRAMIANLDRYLSATQLGITVASLGLGWVGEPAFAHLIEPLLELPQWWSPAVSGTIAATVSFLVITFLHILIGELVPKSIAIRRPEQSALAVAIPMRWAYRLFYIPMLLLNGGADLVLRMFGIGGQSHEKAHSEQELRILLSAAQSSGGLSLTRLLLLENIFDLGPQTVRDAMIPWENVHCLSRSSTRQEVLKKFAEHRYSRWPVLDPKSGQPTGYLLIKDFAASWQEDGDWTRFVRPLRSVHPQDGIEATMQVLQRDRGKMAVVVEQGRPIGLITLVDILEEIVGRIEDEHPRAPQLFLKDTLSVESILLDLKAETPQEAIRTLAASIPAEKLPAGADLFASALAREKQMTTDIGQGVAIPHARLHGLARPLMAFGRSSEGIPFAPDAVEPVRLIFLLVTPAERPNLQVFLLGQLARVAGSEFVRERLSRSESPQEVIEIIAAADERA